MQVVAIDMRGYGESDKPKDRRAYDLSELTADVAEVIKALGHKECAPLSQQPPGLLLPASNLCNQKHQTVQSKLATLSEVQ